MDKHSVSTALLQLAIQAEIQSLSPSAQSVVYWMLEMLEGGDVLRIADYQRQAKLNSYSAAHERVGRAITDMQTAFKDNLTIRNALEEMGLNINAAKMPKSAKVNAKYRSKGRRRVKINDQLENVEAEER